MNKVLVSAHPSNRKYRYQDIPHSLCAHSAGVPGSTKSRAEEQPERKKERTRERRYFLRVGNSHHTADSLSDVVDTVEEL